jgi:betaine reductase
MDPENQAQIKKIAENLEAGDSGNLMVVLGASDLEGALISAETVTDGDPSFSGPLAGVSLRLPVYHILEPDVRDAIPEDIYQEHVGIWAMAVEPDKIEKIGKEFKAIREKASHNTEL